MNDLTVLLMAQPEGQFERLPAWLPAVQSELASQPIDAATWPAARLAQIVWQANQLVWSAKPVSR